MSDILKKNILLINELARSTKVTDKRKCVVQLLELYENKETINKISDHSEKDNNGIISWWNIVNILHNLILYETDRLVTNKTNNKISNTAAALLTTIRYSHESRTLTLKSNSLIRYSLEILQNGKYLSYCYTYLTILTTYVLPVRLYQMNITSKLWKLLLESCINLYNNASVSMNNINCLILNAIQMIIQYGYLYTNLLVEVKQLLPFLVNILNDPKILKQVENSFYKLTSTMCHQIATENRILLCRFSEEILPKIINLNSCDDKYKLMMLFVQIHHPKGIKQGNDGAFACDWFTWNSIIRSMYDIIWRDSKKGILSKYFLQFASEVINQVLLNPGTILEFQNYSQLYLQPVKRKCSSIDTPVDIIDHCDIEQGWPMIHVLTTLLAKYPQRIQLTDLVPLLKILETYLMEPSKYVKVIDGLYDLCTVLMEIERLFLNVSEELQHAANVHWYNIWDILLRSLNTNKSEISAHRLAQCFIKHGKMRNTNSLFALYASQTIRWSFNSLQTLLLCCEHAPLPDDVSMFNTSLHSSMLNKQSVKLHFLEWLLNTSWFKISSKVFVERLCNILIGIPMKFLNENNRTIETSETNLSINDNSYLQDFLYKNSLKSLSYKNIETCNLALTYQINLIDKVTTETVDTQEYLQESFAKANVNIIDLKNLLAILKKHLQDIVDNKNDNNDIQMIVMKITLAVKVAVTVKKMNILMEDTEIQSIMHITRDCLEHAYNLMKNVPNTNYEYLINVIQTFCTLFETFSFTYTDMTEIIISSSTPEILRYLFHFLNIQQDNFTYHEIRQYNDHFNIFQTITNENQMNYKNNHIYILNAIRMHTIRTLTLFCCMNTEKMISKLQLDLLNNLIIIDNYDLSFAIEFKMAMIILELFTQCDKEMIHKTYKDTPLLFLLNLFKNCKENEKYVRCMLKVLPYYIEYSGKYNYNLIELMDHFSELLNCTKFGTIVYIDFFECLSRIIEIKPLLMNHKEYIQYNQKFWTVVNILIKYVQCPFHILRLKAMKCIQKLYSSKNIEYEKKVCFFEKLKNAINNLLSIKNDNNTADEIETRTASALLIFATIICTSSTFQNSALIAVLQLIENKHVKLETVQKLFQSIAKQMKRVLPDENNLAFMLSYWLKNDHTVETFPFVLTLCECKEEFYKMHINTIVLIEVQNFNIDGAKQLCTSIGYNFKDIFQNIFAQVLAWLIYFVYKEEDSINFIRAHTILKEIQLNRGNFQTIDKFNYLWITNFDKIMVAIITRLHDEKHFNEMFKSQYQYPHVDNHSLVISKNDLNGCLIYIESNLISSKSLKLTLISKHINKLQKILMYLVNNIYEMKFTEQKVRAFHQYIYFCNIIMEESKLDYFNPISMFFIRDISYSLLHFIKDKDDIISEIACKYFQGFLKYILPKRHEEIKEHLNYYVTVLTSVAQLKKTSIAIDILEYLIVEQKELFSDVIAELNIFPNLPKFERILNVYNSLKYKNGKEYNLEEEIEHFLNATNQKIINCNMESVTYLNLQLSTKRDELKELYNKLEDNTTKNYNLLHRLICRLLEIIKSSDQNISIEATKCLGQLGPIDLGTTIPYNRKTHVQCNTDINVILTYKIIMLLTEFLVDSDIKLRTASANALDLILASSWGQEVTDKTRAKLIKKLSITHSIPPLRLNYIRPFVRQVLDLQKRTIILDKIACNKYINKNNPIWTETHNTSYIEWIVLLTCNMIECFSEYYLKDLLPVCKLNLEMCELILPKIIYLIIWLKNELGITISHCINGFFYHHFNDTIALSQRVVNCDRNIVYFMLNLVNFIRTQQVEDVPLELDFIYIAKAAQYCSAYFTAFLYAELSCESLLIEPIDFSRVNKIDYVYECEPVLGKMLQNILRDASFKIGDPDAIRGCGSSHLQDISSRVQHYIQMQEWDKVLLIKDIELSSGNKTAIEEMIGALQQLGFHYLLGHCISTMSTSIQEMSNDIQLESAWRLSNWNLPVFPQIMHSLYENNMKLKLSESDYHSYHFYALKCFHERDKSGVENSIKCARVCITKALSNINLESNKEIYGKLTQLQMLSELEELCYANPEDYIKVINKWQQFNPMNFNEFQYVEPILTQRSIMCQINDTLSNNSIIKNELVNTHIKIAEVAQNQGHLQIAARALGTLAKQKELFSEFKNLLDYQESLLAWKRNDYEISRYLLRELIHRKSVDPVLQARVLRIYGNWMAETKSENPQTVINNYYQKSITISKSIVTKTPNVIKNLHDTQVTLARFADTQFEHVKMYMKSSQFKSFKQCVEYSRSVLGYDSKYKNLQDRDIKNAIRFSEIQSTNDAAELKNIEKEKNNYLSIAVKYYLLTLLQSEDYNLLVFRLIALWLENAKNEEINKLLEKNLRNIPSYKFLPVLPQLAAHMNNNASDEFSTKINETLKRCALDHPHHTLPVLLALKNLYGDYEFLKNKKNTKPEEPRILGAKMLLNNLASSKISSIIQEMDMLSHSLVMLANYEIEERCKHGTKTKIPNNQRILKIKHFTNIFVPTLVVDVKCSRNYNNVIGIVRYWDAFENVGGLNAPKKITCVCTDGILREQLLKSKDDLRQDAVMQQVFNVMNRLFDTSKETKRRKLKIRTYKVVPLTQRSGILEWCHNVIPIVNILIGADSVSGVHKKYNPQDYTAPMCRKRMHEATKKSNDVKLQQFLDCCNGMRPAFHHFFIEKYPSPEMWYEKRLTYTRSVATTSIAGYILGLGDRHLGNILMDQQTAEVIHIDFGIAFEQGKVLPIPETVPFRLTRDIEAPMGVSGVEGIMRRGCEEILTVLRDQRQIIITLVQVLLYDPLFTWAITPAKAYTLQIGNTAMTSQDDEVCSETNKTAERALLRIEQKLQGIEEGLVFSISGQVEKLIQQARDPSNLSRLFCGWQPYL